LNLATRNWDHQEKCKYKDWRQIWRKLYHWKYGEVLKTYSWDMMSKSWTCQRNEQGLSPAFKGSPTICSNS
jgi:hypothetical protein